MHLGRPTHKVGSTHNCPPLPRDSACAAEECCRREPRDYRGAVNWTEGGKGYRLHLDTFGYMYRVWIRIPSVSKCIPCIVDSGYVFRCIQHVFQTYGQKIHATIRLQYIHGYNFRNTHPIHPRYTCIQMYSDHSATRIHMDTIRYNANPCIAPCIHIVLPDVLSCAP